MGSQVRYCAASFNLTAGLGRCVSDFRRFLFMQGVVEYEKHAYLNKVSADFCNARLFVASLHTISLSKNLVCENFVKKKTLCPEFYWQ